jgi:hypothetical protein
MKSFLVLLDQGREVWIHVIALKRETSCTYQKEERLKQREIKGVHASILVVGDVSPTHNLQKLC